jgi:hypothetical protein
MLGVRVASLFTGVLAFTFEGMAAAQDAAPAAQSASANTAPIAPLGDSPSATLAPVPSAAVPPPAAPPAPATTPAPVATVPVTPRSESTSSRSGEPSAPSRSATPPRRRPNWNLGAGMTLADSASGMYGSSNPRTPEYRASVERRLYRDTWLTFTGSFSRASYESPVASQQTPPERTRIDMQSTTSSALLGVRQAFVTDLVELSLCAAFVGAWSWTTGDALQPGEWMNSTLPGSKARTLGFSAGFAVERQLIDRLSLRLSSEILQLEWTKSTPGMTYAQAAGDEVPPEISHTQSLLVHVAPVLELRFYF